MKLCWYCNKKFRGKHKAEIIIKGGHHVFVHIACVEEIVNDGMELKLVPKGVADGKN